MDMLERVEIDAKLLAVKLPDERFTQYPIRLTETRTVTTTTGWLHLCPVCEREFRAKKETGVVTCGPRCRAKRARR